MDRCEDNVRLTARIGLAAGVAILAAACQREPDAGLSPEEVPIRFEVVDGPASSDRASTGGASWVDTTRTATPTSSSPMATA